MVKAYTPAGPTVAKFHNSDAPLRLIMGPIGSGKSTGGLSEFLFRATEQAPDSDGVRHTQWVGVRNTFGDLERTTVESWRRVTQHFFGDKVGVPIRRTAGIEHKIRFRNAADGTRVFCDLTFLSLDGEDAIGKLLSMQLHGAFVNECFLIDWNIIQELYSRIGRTAAFGGETAMTWSGLWADTNPPPDTNWVYEKVEEKPMPGLEVFKQPPATIKVNGKWVMNPEAENVHNQPKGERYWLDIIDAGAAEDWISVRMGMKYGFVKEGSLVIDEYTEALHCPDEPFDVDVTIPKIYVGVDFGVWCAVAMGQRDKMDRWKFFFEETACDTNTASFTDTVILPKCKDILDAYRAAGVDIEFDELFVFTGDPAGGSRSSKSDKTDFKIMEERGVNCFSSYDKTNNFERRREVLNGACRTFSKGQPRFIISKACKNARRGLSSRYVFHRTGVKTEEGIVYRMEPKKDQYSHGVDAIVYAMMGAGEGRSLGKQPGPSGPLPRMNLGTRA